MFLGWIVKPRIPLSFSYIGFLIKIIYLFVVICKCKFIFIWIRSLLWHPIKNFFFIKFLQIIEGWNPNGILVGGKHCNSLNYNTNSFLNGLIPWNCTIKTYEWTSVNRPKWNSSQVSQWYEKSDISSETRNFSRSF